LAAKEADPADITAVAIWQGILISTDGKQIFFHDKTNTMSKVLVGFLVGAAVGGALGILLAPDKGTETRRKIMEKGNEMGESLSEWGDSMKSKINEVVDNVKDNFNKTKSSMS
jgi:hypothetical protein